MKIRPALMKRMAFERALGFAAAPVAGIGLGIVVTLALALTPSGPRLIYAAAIGVGVAVLFPVAMLALDRLFGTSSRQDWDDEQDDLATDMLLRRQDSVPETEPPRHSLTPIEMLKLLEKRPEPVPSVSVEQTIPELLARLERGLERRADKRTASGSPNDMPRRSRVDDADGSLRRALDELQRMARSG